MTKTIADKLQIKPGNEVLLSSATPERRALLDPLPEGTSVIDGVTRATTDIAVLFATDRVSLDERLAEALPHLTEARATWIAYPKGNRTDINRDRIWERVEELGWTLTANVSLGDTWSAVRLRPQDTGTKR